MSRQRYRFMMRTLSDPAEFDTFEAGPFTREEAAAYGQEEAGHKVMITGKAWVCHYEEIDPESVPESAPVDVGLYMLIIVGFCALVLGIVSAILFYTRAQ